MWFAGVSLKGGGEEEEEEEEEWVEVEAVLFAVLGSTSPWVFIKIFSQSDMQLSTSSFS